MEARDAERVIAWYMEGNPYPPRCCLTCDSHKHEGNLDYCSLDGIVIEDKYLAVLDKCDDWTNEGVPF